MRVFDWLPPEGFKILLVLFLSFLVGLEREEHAGDAHRGFGGVRTFPLIGLMGYAMALLAGNQIWPVALVFVAISAFLLLSYWHKLVTLPVPGVTSEMAALATYLIGALVSREQFWIATTLAVACMILLELKTALEGLAQRIAPEDIFTFTKFLLLAAVILPIVPNQEFTSFQINPFKTWLVVVAVSGISYGSYVVQKLAKARGGVLLAAILGGAYSSTLTTIVLAKRAKGDGAGIHDIGSDPDCIRRDVSAPGGASGTVQPRTDDTTGTGVHRAGSGWHRRRLVVGSPRRIEFGAARRRP